MIDSEAIAPTRAAGTDYAASHRHGHAKQLCHDAAGDRRLALRRLSLRWSIYLLGPFLL
jgi:hypothetical protein